MTTPETSQENSSWWAQHRLAKLAACGALGLAGLAAIGAIPAAGISNIIWTNNRTAAVQRALLRTGFSGTITELGGAEDNQAYADLRVSATCTLPGVLVNYNTAPDGGASISGFDIALVYPSGTVTNRLFTGPADLPQAFAGQSCSEVAARLVAQEPTTGVS